LCHDAGRNQAVGDDVSGVGDLDCSACPACRAAQISQQDRKAAGRSQVGKLLDLPFSYLIAQAR
jgi:hypothetical protein